MASFENFPFREVFPDAQRLRLFGQHAGHILALFIASQDDLVSRIGSA